MQLVCGSSLVLEESFAGLQVRDNRAKLCAFKSLNGFGRWVLLDL